MAADLVILPEAERDLAEACEKQGQRRRRLPSAEPRPIDSTGSHDDDQHDE